MTINYKRYARYMTISKDVPNTISLYISKYAKYITKYYHRYAKYMT